MVRRVLSNDLPPSLEAISFPKCMFVRIITETKENHFKMMTQYFITHTRIHGKFTNMIALASCHFLGARFYVLRITMFRLAMEVPRVEEKRIFTVVTQCEDDCHIHHVSRSRIK